TELGQRMTNLVTTVRHETDEIYGRLDEAQEARAASDIASAKVMLLHTTVLAQHSEIAALRAADRTKQAQLAETLRLMNTLQAQVTAL
ncbi:hypothetical protein Tco_1356865, partial [Tanacetum coccineum]